MAPHWPQPAVLEQWKATCLQAWDASIDRVEPTAGYKAQRRVVLEQTFDRMIHCAAQSQ